MSHSENMMIQWHCITCHTVMSCAYCGAAMHITQLHHMHAAPLQICHTGISHAHVANVICVSPYQMCIQSHCNMCDTITLCAYRATAIHVTQWHQMHMWHIVMTHAYNTIAMYVTPILHVCSTIPSHVSHRDITCYSVTVIKWYYMHTVPERYVSHSHVTCIWHYGNTHVKQ